MPQRLAFYRPADDFRSPRTPHTRSTHPLPTRRGLGPRGSPTAQAADVHRPSDTRSPRGLVSSLPSGRLRTHTRLAPPQPAEPNLTCLLHNMIYSTDGNFPKSRLTELITNPLTTIFTQHQLQFLKIHRLHCIMFYFNLLKIELLTGAAICR